MFLLKLYFIRIFILYNHQVFIINTVLYIEDSLNFTLHGNIYCTTGRKEKMRGHSPDVHAYLEDANGFSSCGTTHLRCIEIKILILQSFLRNTGKQNFCFPLFLRFCFLIKVAENLLEKIL